MIYTTNYSIVIDHKVIAVNDTARQAVHTAIMYITTKLNTYATNLHCNNVAEHHTIISSMCDTLLKSGVLVINCNNNKKIKIIEI